VQSSSGSFSKRLGSICSSAGEAGRSVMTVTVEVEDDQAENVRIAAVAWRKVSCWVGKVERSADMTE
jgi:hypothetical protein